MAPRLCGKCNVQKARLKRPKTHDLLCRECFFEVFEDEVHQTIVDNNLFKRGERVAIGASGGKDSTVLAEVLTKLNAKYDYGLDLFLLSVDEGITGYRDDSLETVKRNQETYKIPLQIVSYEELYGWTMDEIVKVVGLKIIVRSAESFGAKLWTVGQFSCVQRRFVLDITQTTLLKLSS